MSAGPEPLMQVLDQFAAAGARLIGVAGAQGSGKSTLAAAWAARTPGAIALSLDDFYLTRAAREALGARLHPLCAVRGPPGTHDLGLLEATLDALLGAGTGHVPVFDKARDDRAPALRAVSGVGIVVLEGWCVGALGSARIDDPAPLNAREANEDPGGVWRRWSARALLGPYQGLWRRCDRILHLAAPDWSVVPGWRLEQEVRAGRALEGDANAQARIDAFCALYERVTRSMLEGATRADVTARLDAARNVVSTAQG